MIRGHAFVLLSACAFLLLFSVKAVDIDLRLVNGTTEYEGRVEVRINGTWGTICDRYPSFHDASVICRQLGFSIAERASANSAFGVGPYNTSITYLSCSGYETSISGCYYYTGPNRYCDPAQYTVGVLCSDASNYTYPVRLVNGSSPLEGRVEVRASAAWGTICSSGFDTREATVVCRQLGYYGAVEVFSNSEFGAGTGPVVFSYMYCRGSEAELGDCYHYSYSYSYCNRHTHDVGIRCLDGSNTSWMKI